MSAEAPAAPESASLSPLSELGGAGTGPAPSAPERLATGVCWHDAYQVGELLGEAGARWYRAIQVGDGRAVWMRASHRTSAPGRQALWNRLTGLACPYLQKPVEAQDGDERVEVWTAPGGVSLRSWRAGRPAPDLAAVKELVRQMSAALQALHGAGVGHFAISPDTLFVQESPAGCRCTLAGFDRATLMAADGLIPIEVDPFSAPPEAAGLFKHSPGAQLAAWDWWSLGRAVQEWLLSGPVIQLFDAALAAQLPREARDKAEALLLERNTGGLKAGAVELMPDLAPPLDLLLRGLLTNLREGRWDAADVGAWLAGESPKERYALARHERLFLWRGRGYSVVEAAQILRGPEAQTECVRQVFGVDVPGTFAHFLHTERAHRAAADQLQTAISLATAPALSAHPEALRQEIAAALALLAVGGGAFFWHGRHVTAASLREWLAEPAQAVKLRQDLQALGTSVVINFLQAHDLAAAQLLDALVKHATEAEALVRRAGWVKPGESPEVNAIWQCALEAESGLRRSVEKLRSEYGASAKPELQQIFQLPGPAAGQLVLLAWTALDPVRHGYLTHLEMRRRRLQQLVAQAHGVARLLFWRRLARALRAGPLLFGTRWWLGAVWFLLVGLLAMHQPGPWGVVLGLLPVGLMLLVRSGANRWQAEGVRRWAPEAGPWRWLDGAERCLAEAGRLAQAHGLPEESRAARSLLAQLRREIAELAEPGAPVKITAPPWHGMTWAGSVGCWLLVALLTVGSLWRAVDHRPSWSAHRTAWVKTFGHAPAPPLPDAETKISWPYKKPTECIEVSVQGAFTPTAAQEARAKARLAQLVAPYKPETIRGLVAIYVPLENDDIGLALFDARKGTMLGRTGVRTNFMPYPKMWMQIGEETVLFIAK